jgi:hypothetical protein
MVRKRDPKQLAGAHIFHPFEAERAQRVLNRFPLRVENGVFQLDDDGGFHVVMISALATKERRFTRRRGGAETC